MLEKIWQKHTEKPVLATISHHAQDINANSKWVKDMDVRLLKMSAIKEKRHRTAQDHYIVISGRGETVQVHKERNNNKAPYWKHSRTTRVESLPKNKDRGRVVAHWLGTHVVIMHRVYKDPGSSPHWETSTHSADTSPQQ